MTRSRLPYNASPPTDSRSPSNAPSPKRRRITSSTTKKQHPTRYSSPDELAGRDSSEDQATRYNRRRSSGKVKDTADYPSAVHRRSGRKSKSNSYDDGAELTPTRPPRNEDEGSPDELDHTVHTFYRGRRGRAGSGSGTASGQISGAQSRDGNEDLGTGTGAIHGRGGRRERFRSDDEEMHDQDRKPARLRNESRSQTRNRSRSTRRNRSPSRSRSRNSTRRRRRRSSTHSSILDRPRHYTPDDASRRTASPPPHSPLDTETPAADQDINMTPAGLEEEELDDEALLAEAEADLEAKADREAKEAAEPPKPVEIPYIPYRESMVLRGHKRGVAAVKFSPDGKWIASCSADATIRVWDAGRGKCVHVLEAHMAGISTIAWSPDSETLASGSDDKSIRLWNAVTGEPYPQPLLGHHNYIYSIAFSPKGNMLVSGSYDEAVYLWDVRSGRVMRSLPAHSDPVGGVDFVRDGTLIVSCGGDGLIRVWDTPTGQCLRTLVHEDTPPVTSVRFSPNGKFILAWTLDSCVRLWDYVEGRCLKTYQGHKNTRYSLSGGFGTYSAGTKAFVASGSEDGGVVIWDVTSKEVLQRLEGGGGGGEGVVLGVDAIDGKEGGGGRLVSGGVDGVVRVWVAGAVREDAEGEGEGEGATERERDRGNRVVNGTAGGNGGEGRVNWGGEAEIKMEDVMEE